MVGLKITLSGKAGLAFAGRMGEALTWGLPSPTVSTVPVQGDPAVDTVTFGVNGPAFNPEVGTGLTVLPLL